jgi:tetratricopeptide (TPR) repeat protein
MHVVRWCSAVLCLFFGLQASAQWTGSVDESELTGRVKGLRDDAVCTVELSRAEFAGVVERAVCQQDGSFEFPPVKRGNYNLIIRVGTDQYSEELHVFESRQEIEVQIPTSRVNSESGVVSVAELKIPDKARNELQKATDALAHGDLKKADEHATRALAEAPRFARAMTLKAVLLAAKKDFNAALQMINSASGIDANAPMTQFVRASVLNAVGNPREAQAAAERALQLGSSWQARYELAKALVGQGQYKQALAQINQAAVNAPPSFGELLLMRASVLFHLEDLIGARESLTEFLKQNPGDARGAKMQALLAGVRK